MKSITDSQENDNATPPGPIARSVDDAFRLTAATILLSSLYATSTEWPYGRFILAGSALLAAAYIALALLLTHQRPVVDSKNQSQALFAYIDVFIIGACLFLIPFSVITTATLILITALRAVLQGGLPRLLGQGAAMACGALLTALAFQPVIELPAVEYLHGLSLVAIVGFLVLVSSQTYQRQQLVDTRLKAAKLDLLQQKLNNYKLAKYLSPSLRKAIYSGKRVALETQRKRLTVFFSDIKGFSELSEELETETLTEMLNLYLTEMSDIALKFGGTVDKFIGDAIMIFFGDPLTRGAKEDAAACVSMAIAMQKRMDDLNKRWAAQGIKRKLFVRMGINTGFCTVGNFGTENRMDYTLLGTEVNKASRLESAADSGQILISRATYELVKDIVYCEARGHLRLKGYNEPVEAFSAVDLRANLGKNDLCVEHTTEGFNIFLDLETIPHMQKQRAMATLETAYERLRKDIVVHTKDDVKIFK